jgi:transposase InsO family protein
VSKPKGKLTPIGRKLLVDRITRQGYPVARAAEMQGVSRSCAYHWLRRWRAEGEAGLEDRSCRPHRSPRRLDPELEARILAARARLNLGPHQLGWRLGLPRSTVYAVLRRHGVNRLDRIDRPTGQVVRYQREHPGELLHVDVKKLGRIPDGGGWRVHGRGRGGNRDRKQRLGYDYLHVAVDDRTRLAYVEIHADERGDTCAGFLQRAGAWFAEHGVIIQRVMTDNAFAYRYSRAFQDALADLASRHLRTQPYRPQTNGKAERFNKTMGHEWAYARVYGSNLERAASLDDWLHDYNHHRPHTSLNGRSPMDELAKHVPGQHS